MKPRYLLSLFICIFSVQANAGEAEASPAQERDFLAKAGTIVYAPVDLAIQNRKSIILSGIKGNQGECIIQNKDSVSSTNALPRGYSLITIELAHNPISCESLVYKGIVPSTIRQAPPTGIKKTQTRELIPSADSVNSTTLPMSGGGSSSSFFTTLTDSASTTAPTMTGVAYTVWTDGNHPVMQTINYEIEVNSVRDEITAPYNFCSGEAHISASNEYYAFFVSGWSLDATSTWSYGNDCSTYPGTAFVGASAKFSNAIFPGCFPGVFTNYRPNQVTLSGLGGATWNQNIYKSGVIAGCGEYLRFYFLNSYE